MIFSQQQVPHYMFEVTCGQSKAKSCLKLYKGYEVRVL